MGMKQRCYLSDCKQLFSAPTFDRLRGILGKYQEDLLVFKKMFRMPYSGWFSWGKIDKNLPFKSYSFFQLGTSYSQGTSALASWASFHPWFYEWLEPLSGKCPGLDALWNEWKKTRIGENIHQRVKQKTAASSFKSYFLENIPTRIFYLFSASQFIMVSQVISLSSQRYN